MVIGDLEVLDVERRNLKWLLLFDNRLLRLIQERHRACLEHPWRHWVKLHHTGLGARVWDC